MPPRWPFCLNKGKEAEEFYINLNKRLNELVVVRLSEVKEAVTLLKGYVRLYESPKSSILTCQATGFFFRDEGETFLITNEHVLQNLSFLEASVHTRRKWVDLELWGNHGKKLWECWKENDKENDKKMDLAALKIPTDKLMELGMYSYFTKDHIVEDVLGNERIDIGTPIVVLGYPKGFCDRQNYYPIARGAMISSKHWWSFKREKCFLIDGSLPEGMSGSPVVISTEMISDNVGSQDVVSAQGKDFKLIGVFSGSWVVGGEEVGANKVYPADRIPKLTKKLVGTP